MNTKESISNYIDSKRDEMTADLAELIRIPSVMSAPTEGCPFGENNVKALKKAEDICKKYGFYTKNCDNYAISADLLENEEKHLGILCHLDVVPEGNGWTKPPFELTAEDGKLFGRGAIDDKGPAIAAIYAMRCVKELGLPIEKNVRLILGTNEENGSADMEYYQKKESFPPLLFTPDGSFPLINIEKGMMRIKLSHPLGDKLIAISGGAMVNAVPENAKAEVRISAETVKNAAKDRSSDIKFDIKEENGTVFVSAYGKSAHASTPELGVNALTALLELLADCGVTEAKAFAKLFPFGETDGTSCGIKCSDKESGAATTVLSMAEISDEKLICMQDIRFPVCESCKGILSKLEAAAKAVGIDIEPVMQSEPHHVPANSDFVRTLLNVYEDVTGEKGEPIAIGGGTYVHETANGVAFGAEFPGDENNMHGADEFITEKSLLLNAKIYANAIAALCGKDDSDV
ncbi:MAG: dipeptidase PepV [Oscillospiraceae bacterium]